MADRHRFSPYWNKTEAFWWIASGLVVIAYAVAVLAFGADPDPMVWIEDL
jgi:hypothetical protein